VFIRIPNIQESSGQVISLFCNVSEPDVLYHSIKLLPASALSCLFIVREFTPPVPNVTILSPAFNHAFAASPSANVFSITTACSCRLPLIRLFFINVSNVVIYFVSNCSIVALLGKILIGLLPKKNHPENKTNAVIKFIITPPHKIITLRRNVAVIKLSGALKVPSSFGSSHLSLTKPPSGIILTVYSVPDLSV